MIKLEEYKEGDVVLPEGELGKGFCILESGVLEVIRGGRILSEIDMPGAIFGELSELLALKRDAVIRAKTPSKVRHIEESISSLVEKNPKVALKLLRTLGRRLYRMNRVAIRQDEDGNVFKKAEADVVEDGLATAKVRILIVDDKPNIIKQLTEIFARSEWVAESAHDEDSAIRACEHHGFSAILISMALDDDAAIDVRRKLKTNHNVLNTPILGMIVKGDEAAQKKALNSGFSDCITKPFDPNKTEAIMYKVMNLDSSARYFKFVDDYLYFKVPDDLSTFVINDIKENMDNRIRNTINEGIVKLVIDVSELDEVGEEAIEVVGEFAEKIEDMKLPMRGAIVATGEDAEMWNNLDGCEEWGICEDLQSATEHLSQEPDSEEEGEAT
jgi:DNA-binding response OmpR family regulator